jgi:hypothetical protein
LCRLILTDVRNGEHNGAVEIRFFFSFFFSRVRESREVRLVFEEASTELLLSNYHLHDRSMAKFEEADPRWKVKDLGEQGKNVNSWYAQHTLVDCK